MVRIWSQDNYYSKGELDLELIKEATRRLIKMFDTQDFNKEAVEMQRRDKNGDK